jgi:cellulose biosynthesis protein BcsE
MPAHFVGINNLPNSAAQLMVGEMYAVVHNDSTLSFNLICEILLAASVDSRAVWLTEFNPAQAFNSSSGMGLQMWQATQRGNIRIFEIASAKSAKSGNRILEELDFLNITKGSLIVIEGADRLLDSANPETWDAETGSWQRWAEQAECALLCIYPKRIGRTDPELDIMRIAHRFSGYARLQKLDNEVRWDIFHWFGTEGLIADKSFRLSVKKDKSWRVVPVETLPENTSEQAADANEVFSTFKALADAKPTPAGWRIFETPEQMSSALSASTAATAIFHYNSESSLEAVARTVFELRRAIGSRIKIAVREVGVRLRHSHEQLLLNMGANLIIPTEISFSRMLNMLKTVQGQIYSRPLQEDYESTIASVMPVSKMGYLAPGDFVTSVSEALIRASVLSIHNVLIRFPLTAGLGALETLRCCFMKRPGDLCTADGQSVYVFLFACEEQGISLTLERLFRLPVSVLFSGELRYLTSKDIAETIAELNLRAGEFRFPDYTAELTLNHGESSATMNTLLVNSKPAQTVARLVSPAVPHPLKLRAKLPEIANP